jgi:CubicO group peptidase (beta-lactamase class C family)
MTRLLAAALVAALAVGAPALAAPKAVPKPAATASFPVDKARIDAALADMVVSGRAAGVMAVVWKDGAERYFGTAGFADREAQRPMTRDTLVQIWSMTKPVTGVAMMQLWEQGRFQLDDPVAKYLPEFASMRVYAGQDAAGQPTYRPATRPILIRDLMRHTAGLAYGPGAPAVDADWKRADPLNLQNDLPEMGRKLATVPLLFDPGKQWSYSAAVDVQALLVQTLSGQPFETYVREHILTPLAMKDTAWTQPQANLPRLAATYSREPDGKLVRDPDAQTRRMNFGPRKLTMGGAGLVASIDDYLRFSRMLLNGGELDGARLLKPSTIKLMATDQLDPSVTERIWLPSKGSVGFGLDFAVRKSQPQSMAENRGAVGEFFWDGAASTLFWVDPANRLAAVLFVQRTPFDGTLHHDFRQAVYGPAYLGPKGD